MRTLGTSTLIVWALLSVLPATAAGQSSPTQIGSKKAWDAYTYTENGNKICYMVSKPTRSRPAKVRRGDIYFMVTHRPAEGVRDEVSIFIGYPYKVGAPADVRIGSQSYVLVTEGENAWAPDRAADARLVKMMIRGTIMDVRGQSARGTKTTDRFSLLGFTAAHRLIDQACK